MGSGGQAVGAKAEQPASISMLEAELERILADAGAAFGWFPEVEFVVSEELLSQVRNPGSRTVSGTVERLPPDGRADVGELAPPRRPTPSEPVPPKRAQSVENASGDDPRPAADDVLDLLATTAAALSRTSAAATPAVSIDRIAALETLINAAAGLLAAEEVAFAETQRAAHLAAKVRARDVGRGTAEQIGFARRVSPTSAARHLGYALTLQTCLPETYRELRAGRISEVQARIAVTRSSHLGETDAAMLDAAIAPRLHGWSPSATEKAVDQIAYSLDPRGSVDRKATAEQDRRVWVRPAPDSMAIVSALLPMAQGVAVWANLRSAALTLHGTGESGGRGIGQLMADLLVERCTGQATAAAVPVEVRVTVPADSVLGDAELPAWVDDYGPVPASVVRELIGCGSALSLPRTGEPPSGPPSHWNASGNATQSQARNDRPDENCCCTELPDDRVRLRRIFTDPIDGSVVDVDAHSRLFPASMRRHIAIRDRRCRQPYCDAPIRDIDHVEPYARGGRTTLANGQGLCLRGNQIKEMPGWTSRRRKDGTTLVVTPTGHRYVRDSQSATGLPALTRRE